MGTIEKLFKRHMDACYLDVNDIPDDLLFDLRMAFYSGFRGFGNMFEAYLKDLPKDEYDRATNELKREFMSFAELVGLVYVEAEEQE